MISQKGTGSIRDIKKSNINQEEVVFWKKSIETEKNSTLSLHSIFEINDQNCLVKLQ